MSPLFTLLFHFVAQWSCQRLLTNAPNAGGINGLCSYGFICLAICAIVTWNPEKQDKEENDKTNAIDNANPAFNCALPMSMDDCKISDNLCKDVWWRCQSSKENNEENKNGASGDGGGCMCRLEKEKLGDSSCLLFVDLVQHFFQMVFNFDYKYHVLTPNKKKNEKLAQVRKGEWMGKCIEKEKSLSFEREIERSNAGNIKQSNIIIEDPVDCIDNPARNVTDAAWRKIRHESMRGYLLIKQAEKHNAPACSFLDRLSMSPKLERLRSISGIFYA